MNSWLSQLSQTFDILGITVEKVRSLGGTDGGESFLSLALNDDRLDKPPKSSAEGGGFVAGKA